MDEVADRKKGQVSGQITLFDIASDEQKKEFRVSLPDQDEFPKEILLSFEKEVLGIYISGHPLDDYKSLMKKNCTASSLDFMLPGGAESEENNDKGRDRGQKDIHGRRDRCRQGEPFHQEQSADGLRYDRGYDGNDRGYLLPEDL